jgi:tetratricopeptide (TPR) repeat protein
MKRPVVVLSVMGAMFLAPLASAQDHAHAEAPFGKVTFPTSCSPAVQARFEAAVAMLHSFFYPETVKAFQGVVEADPHCAMGYWGLAASQRGNPLVTPWPADNLKRALEAIEKGKMVAATARERDWLEALEAAYKDYDKIPNTTRSERYEEAMAGLVKKYPGDREAAIFYALALLEAVNHADKTYRRQIAAGEILEQVAREQPDHPGLAHYIIHAYDFEPLAERGVAAADKYAALAPAAPHAQHMPSHIYSMLGRWESSIRSNQKAIAASRDYAAKNFPGTTFAQEPHAQDFMAYAFLQLGRDHEAKRVIDELAAIQKYSGARTYGRDTGEIAPAARYVLERAAWSEAAALPVRENVYTYAQAIPRFTRAVAAAHLGDPATANNETAELGKLAAQGEDSYWAEQIKVLVLAASAWTNRAERQDEEALKLMRSAADLEDSSEKHVSMENRLYPMREMLGDLLLELGRPGDALAEYEKSNHATPNRLRGLYGAAKAAEAAGDSATARLYFTRLAALGEAADPERAEIAEAKAWLARKG